MERVGSAPHEASKEAECTQRSATTPAGPRSPTRSPSTRTTSATLLTGIDGFQAYYVVRDNDGPTTISVFEDQAGALESIRAAAEWVAENLADLGGAPPSDTGEVVFSF